MIRSLWPNYMIRVLGSLNRNSLKEKGSISVFVRTIRESYGSKVVVVPKNHDLQKQILDEAHLSKFSIHSDSTKMYQDLRKNFWWTRMKREIAKYVSECDTCQRAKASHLKVAGLLQPLPIPSWKWEDISMDFIVRLPNTSQKHDSIWVIVDRLTKTAHFIPVHTTYTAKKYAEIYLDRIVCLHGVPKTIISVMVHSSLHAFGNSCKHLLGQN